MFVLIFFLKGLPTLLEFIIDEIFYVLLDAIFQGKIFHYEAVVRQRSGFFIIIFDRFSNVIPNVYKGSHVNKKASTSQNDFVPSHLVFDSREND